ncbi:MAG: hypothetical protein CVU54_02055 [Deltaproteobacteria bacterium HGW-Deltaproteobacteria-12]|jgi:hypothetical protein|nr:MAG: hypothetical protein CVU54_02055 [Deltaproteobacteria bacterium HGW-Deltaproteobacteria-12]
MNAEQFEKRLTVTPPKSLEELNSNPFLGDESTHNKFSGYSGVIPENMAIPVALFLSEQEAIQYAAEKYGEYSKIKKYPASSEFSEALRRG